jgi:hypothetical protein
MLVQTILVVNLGCYLVHSQAILRLGVPEHRIDPTGTTTPGLIATSSIPGVPIEFSHQFNHVRHKIRSLQHHREHAVGHASGEPLLTAEPCGADTSIAAMSSTA